MTTKFRFVWRTGLFGFRTFMLLVLIVALAVAGFVWRISNRPYDIGFAKSYIQDALYDNETGNHARMDRVVLFWPELSGPLYIQLRGGKVLNRENDVLLSVDEISLSFSGLGLLRGRVLPTSIVLKAPLLRVSRLEDNSFDFGFGTQDSAKTQGEEESMIARMLGYIARPGAEEGSDSPVSHLEGIEIRNARLVVSDHVLGVSWYVPDFSAAFASTDEGMQARFNLYLPQGRGKMSGINMAMRYFWEDKSADMVLDVEDLDLMVLAGKMPEIQIFDDMHKTVNAHFEGRLAQGFIPQKLFGSMVLDGVKIDADVDFKPKEGEATFEEGTVGRAKLSIAEIPQSKMDAIWPKPLRGDASEEWVVQKMADGVFKDLWASVDLVMLPVEKGGYDFDARHVMAGFSFENMSVNYRHPMPPATKLYGQGSFDLDKDELRIAIDKGALGDMEVEKAALLFDRVVAVGEGGADLDINLKGGVQNILRFVSGEPINMGKRLDMDLDKVKGEAALRVGLQFPTHPGVKMDEFKITANGTLTDVFLPEVIEKLSVSGGPMTLDIKDGKIAVNGKGKLDGRDMDFEWSEFLESDGAPYTSKVKASLIADPALRKLFGIDLDDFIDGSVGVSVDYTSLPDKTALADIEVDLTPGVFFVKPFGFNKPVGEEASAKFKAHLKNKELQEITHLSGQGKDFTLSNALIKFKKIKDETQLWSGNLSAFTLGRSKGKLNFQFDNKGAAKIVLDADSLDIQGLLAANEGDGKEYDEPPMVISATAKTMHTAPKESVSNAKVFIDIDGQGRFNQMEMDAVAGKGQIYMRYKPNKEGTRVFNLQTDDAGAALKAFQVYSNIRGGKLVIYGEPMRGVLDRNIIGAAEITEFNVVNTPILTRLLSLMSLSGIAEILGGEGLNFTRLEADFNWMYRKEGALLVLKNGRTSGNSIGLTFDGTFDNAKRLVDVSGTIVPMSAINGFLGKIPLVGQILTGGSGGVFAATYSIKGSSEKTDISVNPLSVLTPGIIRRILFE